MMGGHYHKFISPITLGVLLLSVIGLNACSQQAPIELGDKVPTTVNVTITDSGFSPATVTVSDSAGAYVIWTNNDTVTHIVRSDDDLFDSGDLGQGETYAHLLNKPGIFKYHCRIHPDMKSEITVIYPKAQP